MGSREQEVRRDRIFKSEWKVKDGQRERVRMSERVKILKKLWEMMSSQWGREGNNCRDWVRL